MALISISSIHLLKTFISPDQNSTHTIMWQVIIHVAFLVSALVMALVDRLTTHTHPKHFEEPAVLHAVGGLKGSTPTKAHD
jgi:uncharacterized protein (TIGR00645 family)